MNYVHVITLHLPREIVQKHEKPKLEKLRSENKDGSATELGTEHIVRTIN